MKKFVKYTALTALVLTLVGVVLLTIGAIGGSVKGIKTLDVLAEKIKAGEFSIDSEDFEALGDLLDQAGTDIEDLADELEDIGIDIGDLFGDIDIDIHHRDSETNIRFANDQIIYEGGSQNLLIERKHADKMDIVIAGGQVTFKNSSDGEFHVQASGIGKLQAYVENNTFYLKSAKTGVNIALSDIVLEVPKGVSFEKLSLDIGAGSVEIDELKVDSLTVQVGAGALVADYLEANEAKFSVGAGEIEIKDGYIGYLKSSVGAGSTEIEAVVTGDIDADVALGELCVIVKGSDESKHNFRVDCAMGETQVGSHFWSGVAVSNKHIDNGATSTYDLDCAMGSLIILFED